MDTVHVLLGGDSSWPGEHPTKRATHHVRPNRVQLATPTLVLKNGVTRYCTAAPAITMRSLTLLLLVRLAFSSLASERLC